MQGYSAKNRSGFPFWEKLSVVGCQFQKQMQPRISQMNTGKNCCVRFGLRPVRKPSAERNGASFFAYPAMNRWAFLFRPAGRDWGFGGSVPMRPMHGSQKTHSAKIRPDGAPGG